MSAVPRQVRLIALIALATSGLARAQTAGDPKLGSVLDPRALVREVLARNPSLAAAQAAIREAQAKVSQAGALDDPQLRYSVAPISLFDSSAPDGHQLEVEQRFPFPGKRGLAADRAESEVKVADADADQVRLELGLEAVRLFDAWFTVHRALQINQQHLALMRAFKQSAEAEYTTGQASQQDPLQAEVELTHLEHQRMVLGADRDVLRAQINGLLHRPPEAPLPPPPAELKVADAMPPPAEALIATAIQQRPELAAARAKIGGAGAALALAKRQTWPDFSVMAQYNSMWPMTAHQWMVGVGINLPVPWDKRQGERDEAAARAERLGFEQERLLDQISTEVETARLRLTEAMHVAQLYASRLLPAAQDQVTAARAGFVAGKVPFNTLVGAEQNLRSVELAAAQSLADADLRHAELDRALGQLPGATPSGVSR